MSTAKKIDNTISPDKTITRYLIGSSEILSFRSNYRDLTKSKCKNVEFFVKAWVSEKLEDGKVKIVTTDEFIELTSREVRDDEKQRPTRQDTLYGDLKLLDKKIARGSRHSFDERKVSLLVDGLDPSQLAPLTIGQQYYFKIVPANAFFTPSLASFEDFAGVSEVKVDNVFTLQDLQLTSTYEDYKKDRLKKAIKLCAVLLMVVAGVHFLVNSN